MVVDIEKLKMWIEKEEKALEREIRVLEIIKSDKYARKLGNLYAKEKELKKQIKETEEHLKSRFPEYFEDIISKIKKLKKNTKKYKRCSGNPDKKLAKKKIKEFIEKLELSCEADVQHIKRNLYEINGRKVNIYFDRKINNREEYWYSVSQSIMKEAKYVIFLPNSTDEFFMFKTSELKKLRCYDEKSRPENKKGHNMVINKQKMLYKPGDIDISDKFYSFKEGILPPFFYDKYWW